MTNEFTTSNEVWSEFFASTGLLAALALCSGTLSERETNIAKAINNFAVANSYVRHDQIGQTIWLVKIALTRTTGGTD